MSNYWLTCNLITNYKLHVKYQIFILCDNYNQKSSRHQTKTTPAASSNTSVTRYANVNYTVSPKSCHLVKFHILGQKLTDFENPFTGTFFGQ